MKTRELPKTDSIQELARFWDTHDLKDFDGQIEDVSDPVFVRDSVIPLHLRPTEAELVSKLAKASGVADAELVRRWVLEKIRAD